jgi:hypothetical protein
MSTPQQAARPTPHPRLDPFDAIEDVAFLVMWISFVAVMAAILLFLIVI